MSLDFVDVREERREGVHNGNTEVGFEDTDLAEELKETVAGIAERDDESLTWRLREANKAVQSLTSDKEDTVDFETGPNGAKLNKEERDAFAALVSKLGLD